MIPKATLVVTGTAPSDRKVLTPDQQAAIGYDRESDTPWDTIVDQQPGDTWGERLRSAIQLTLEDYGHDKDLAIRDLRDAGAKGLIRFAADGTPIGGKALAGALRAADKHPRMHRMYTQSETAELEAERERQYRAGINPRSKRHVLTDSERQYRADQQARRQRAREVLERTGGGTDLRRSRSASKLRAEKRQGAGQARRESFRRAVREAEAARKAATQAAQRAAVPA